MNTIVQGGTMRSSGLIVAFCVIAGWSAVAADVQYWPNGETATPPYAWSTAANWAEKVLSPTEPLNRVPTAEDKVYLAADQLAVSPLVIGKDDVISVAALYVGYLDRNNTTSTATYGTGNGTTVRMAGGTLDVSGAFYVGYSQFGRGIFHLDGGTVTAGSFGLGSGTSYAESPELLTIDNGASFTVSGAADIGLRTQKTDAVVTNEGSFAFGSLRVGPSSNSFYGRGVIVNKGTMTANGDVAIGRASKTDSQTSYAKLYLAAGSSLVLNGHSLTVGASGCSGLLDVSTPLDLADPVKGGTIGFSAANTSEIAVHDTFFKTAKLPLASNSGAISTVSADGGAVLDIEELSNPYQTCESTISLSGSSVLTNLSFIRIGYPVGSRVKTKMSIDLKDRAEIRFAPDGTGEILGGSQSDGYATISLAGQSAIRGVKALSFAAGKVSDNPSVDAGGGDFTLAGGTVEFDALTADASFAIGIYKATKQICRVSGYGTFTRSDLGADISSYALDMSMPTFDWRITADGDGISRDLDFHAVRNANGAATYGNRSGTNGWFAVNKGRVIYPRASPIAYDSKNKYRYGIGEYNKLGASAVPTLVNSAVVNVPSSFDGTGFMYAELYAADREDVPADIPVSDDGKVLAVWRLGLADDWQATTPEAPVAFSGFDIDFAFDKDSVPAGIDKVYLWRHSGKAGDRWRRVKSATVSAADGHVVLSGVASNDEDWNIGYVAIGAGIRPSGMVLVVR